LDETVLCTRIKVILVGRRAGDVIRQSNMGCGQSNGALVVTPGTAAQKPEHRQQNSSAVAGDGEGFEAPNSAQATPRSCEVAPPSSSVSEELNPNETVRMDSLTHLQGAVETFLSEARLLQGLQIVQAQPPDKSAEGKSEGALVVLQKAMEMYELSLSEEVRARAMVRT